MDNLDNLVYQLKDSASDSHLKRLKPGETFGVKKPGGEARLHFGPTSNEKELDKFFGFNESNDTVCCLVSKIDLLDYLIMAKEEFFNPMYSYRTDISKRYPIILSETIKLPDSFEIKFKKNADKQRYYLSPVNDGETTYTKNIKNICLPELTEFNFIRAEEDDKITYFFKPMFKAPSTLKTKGHTILEYAKSSSDNPYLRAIRTKPFLLLAGISGTGKSRIVRKMAQATVTEELQKKYDKNFTSEDFSKDRWELHRPANFELIQVKPNWHNSMEVVGYLSNIPSPHYVFTPFINFIIKAWQNPEVPFFLCLDEMNLAPVEEYFAEFLSAIESRDKQDGQYVTDPIIKPFSEFGKIENDKGEDVDITANMLKSLFPDIDITNIDDENLRTLVTRLKTKGLTLPPNLIVIGTVNMDETTFSFSRKVLDRAMSIEMNEVNYDVFLDGDTDEGLKELVENRDDINDLLVNRPIQAKEVLDAVGHDKDAVIGYLKRINTLLEGTPFKLGYRAANEAMLYLNASYDFGNKDWREAMDQFTLMKILSRIEGDTNKLKIGNGESDQKRLKDSGVEKEEAEKHGPLTLLTTLRVIIEDELREKKIKSDEAPSPEVEEEPLEESSEETPSKMESRELESIRKLDCMISQLERERFVSYWN